MGTDRPLIGRGDYGSSVREVQEHLRVAVDGDFGPDTEAAVEAYQARKGLSVDGVVGPDTWRVMEQEFDLAPYPPPLPDLLPDALIERICTEALESEIADYSWDDRGVAPRGYITGMAVTFAQSYARLLNDDPIAHEMARADSGNESEDVLAWYESEFKALGMSNREAGAATLRHLYALMLGLGMRETSGEFCCGRDQSASNTDADTCEAGLFQTSWNASVCCTDFIVLTDQYDLASPQGYQNIFADEVSCPQSDWACYGSGAGRHFQELCKFSPAFAVETAAITLRNLRQHYGPINRKEAELRPEADDMFRAIQDLMDRRPGDV